MLILNIKINVCTYMHYVQNSQHSKVCTSITIIVHDINTQSFHLSDTLKEQKFVGCGCCWEVFNFICSSSVWWKGRKEGSKEGVHGGG